MRLGGRAVTLLLLAGAANGGCLITDPVLAVEDLGNTPPNFYQINPDNSTTVFIANTTTPVTFTAKARDRETPNDELYYEWVVDNGPVVLEGPDQQQYTTSGAALGPGVHIIRITVTDASVDTEFVEEEWQVQVQ